jgi:DNA polymerase III alpha subunit
LAEIAKRYPDAIAAERIVFVKGKVDKRRETPGVLVSELIPVEDALARLTRAIKVEIEVADGAALLAQLRPILERHRGKCETFVQVPANGSRKTLIRLDPQWHLRPTPALLGDLQAALAGRGRVELAGDGTRRTRRLQQQLFEDAEAPEVPQEPPAMAETADDF